MADDTKIAIPRQAFTGLIITLVLAMLALVFLLGRMSASSAAPPPPSAPVAIATPQPMVAERHESQIMETAPKPEEQPQAAPAVSVPTATVEDPMREPATVAPAPQPSPALPVSAVPVGHRVAHVAAAPPRPVAPATFTQHVKVTATNGQKAEVQAYLHKIESLTAGTGDLGDPNEFANKILGQASVGDSSAFDDLIGKVRAAQNQLANIKAPAPCAEHYHLIGAQLQGSLALLQGLKKATVSQDTSGLMALAAQGQAMQSQTKRLEILTAQLKTAYQ